MISEHRYKRRVQFYETDAAGIVHFSNFFRYMEEAEHSLWREAGLSISQPGSEIGWPRVAAAFDYFRPLRFEEEFEVRLRIDEIAEKRIRYSCLLTSGGAKVAAGSMTIVCVRKTPDGSMRSTPIPAEIAGRFAAAGADTRHE